MNRLFKRTVSLIWLSAVCWGAPTVTPSTPTVTVGGTVKFASPDSVTWSMASGSTGTINSSGLYTATTTFFSAKNQMAGCTLRPNDDIVNTRIDNLPIDSSSTARIANLITVIGQPGKLNFQMSFPLNVYNAQTSSQTFVFRSTHGNDGKVYPIYPFPYRGEEATSIPNDYFAQDHHITGISTDTCHAYEMYQYYPTGSDPVAPLSNAGAGFDYYGMSYDLPDITPGAGGADAAGMAIMPISLRYSELSSGRAINHALRFTLDNGNIYSGYLWPAVDSTNECASHALCFPYGSRLRMKSTYSCAGMSSGGKILCNTLKQYGMILADGGSVWSISAMYDANSDTTTWSTLFDDFTLGASSVSSNDFEQVDESTLMLSSSTGKVNLSNAYVVPENYAEVIATKISDSSTTTVRVAIQPVTVGFLNTPFQSNGQSVNVMAGTPQFSIPFWVNGTTDTTASCTMSPTLGTLTTGCLYTAPTSFFNKLSSTTVTITPTISAGQATTFPLVIFSSDGIRMREGPATSGLDTIPPFTTRGDYVDSSTRTWFMDPVGSLPNFYQRSTQGSTSWPDPDKSLFNSMDYGSGDKAWSAMVPNGNYILRLGFGSNNSGDVAASTNCIDTQGTIFASSISLVSGTIVANIISTGVIVSNNQFYWSLRGNQQNSHNFISFWSLLPSSSPFINSALTASGTTGSAFTYQITATNTPTSYNASPLPNGLSIDTATGIISGTPTTPGTTNTIMSATNAVGTGQNTLVITLSGSQLALPTTPLTMRGIMSMRGIVKVRHQ